MSRFRAISGSLMPNSPDFQSSRNSDILEFVNPPTPHQLGPVIAALGAALQNLCMQIQPPGMANRNAGGSIRIASDLNLDGGLDRATGDQSFSDPANQKSISSENPKPLNPEPQAT